MSRFHTLKAGLLALLIVAGFTVQGKPAHAAETETIIVAGGCFWCVESDFERVTGVIDVISGYASGTLLDATYTKDTNKRSGRYEAVQIKFDPNLVTRAQLYHLYFRSIDPTDAGGQFCDRGETYRTAIFVQDDAQSKEAVAAKHEAQSALGRDIVTRVIRAKTFSKAQSHHQDYYKGSNLVVTRFGTIKQSDAYKRYRKGCGRDARVQQLWGKNAPFVSH
ncbi:peptide-methionine (S)-S-oxide reductase MsrA [Planktotalea sp.]|uniref:peptide-methionine (S)-S-oxide reductase MsrA n=1 Tax=Planktotalea sp. TaxID=2029877 RepID=UPI00329A7E37